jgi:hypothetical protein
VVEAVAVAREAPPELEDLEELAALVLLVFLCPEDVERWLHVGDAVSEGLRAVYGELPGAAPHA